jgi:N-acetylmuramoyl-L-alanine amidase
VATAATVQPRIVSRAGWGADERIRGWNDIGYNFLVDRYGRVFEGRYGGITRAVLGAHAGGFNTYTTGVALLGTFTTSRPTSPMLASLERLLAWKLDLTHVDPRGRTVLTSAGGANTRYPAGRRVVVNTILGHRSTSYTTCPGDPTIGLLPRIRSAVSRIGRPKIYGGSATTSRVRPEQGGYAGVHARFSSTARWKVAVTGSNGATVRSFTGAGSEAKVRWNGRTAGSTLAPPGWATMTVTAAAGGATARPVTSRVFVDRTPPPAGSSTGGYSAGAWRVSNVNAEQLSTSAGVFASYRWGRSGDIPVVGTATATAPRPSAWSGPTPPATATTSCSATPMAACSTSGMAATATGSWSATGTATAPGPRPRSGPAPGRCGTATPPGRPTRPSRSGAPATATWPATGTATATSPRACSAPAPSGSNSGGSGPSEVHVRFGHPSDHGFAGDWNGNGTWTPGVLRGGTRWYLKDSFTGGTAAVGLAKQTPGTPVVGDWDNRP